MQGSYGSLETWKVMEFKNYIFQAWKVMEFLVDHGKSRIILTINVQLIIAVSKQG